MLKAIKLQPKCRGQAPNGSMVCSDRNRCGCYLRPDAPGQIYEPHYKAGDRCQHYESVPEQYHITDDVEEPAKVGWD